MALTPKEREKIVEEETLRFETRNNLHMQACAKHPRRGRWLWVLGAVLLGWALYCHFMCGGASCFKGGPGCKVGHHGMMMEGKKCPHGGMMGGAEDQVEPGQPLPAGKK
jgi:hypothetical protein